MSKKNNNYILYDGTCPACQKSVAFIKAMDKKKLFTFIPLQDAKAKELCEGRKELLSMNSVILYESKQKIWIRAKAIFRIFWLLGGLKKAIGWLYILPSWIIDPFYRLFARFRHRF